MTRRRRHPKQQRQGVIKTPSHYEIMYDGDARPVTFDARALTLPAAAIIGVVGAFIWGTYVILGERSRLDDRISNTVTAIERLASSVERLASLQAASSADRWTRLDHDLWCAKAEKTNKGFTCPSVVPSQTAPDVLSKAEETIRKEILKSLRENDGKR